MIQTPENPTQGTHLSQKLGEVDVLDGSKDDLWLGHVGHEESEVIGRQQDGPDGSHTVVVVVLGRQLLRAQPVRVYDLPRQAGHRREWLWTIQFRDVSNWQYDNKNTSY